MITDFVNSAIVIDDNPQETEGLLEVLKEQDILYSSFTPIELKTISFKKNRHLIFLDLSLDDSKKIVENISLIRALFKKSLGKDFGIYGIVVWSKHQHHIDLLKEKLHEDRINAVYSTPIFIVGLDKTKYIQQGNYNGLLNDIEAALLTDSAATFFLEWSNSIQKAQDTTAFKIYSLLPNYQSESNDLTFILKELAKNYTGIHESKIKDYPSLYIDAYKSLNDILHAELINSQKSKFDIFSKGVSPFSKQDELTNIYARLNSALFVDTNNIVQNIVIPGNIYKIIIENELLKIDGAPKRATKIAIEITPPCDFSQTKNGNPRVVSGFMFDWTNGKEKQDSYLKSFGGDARYCIYPIKLSDITEPQFVCFDFRYTTAIKKEDLQDPSKYEIFFRAKPKLFADILQKFSAHAARLGLSIIR